MKKICLLMVLVAVISGCKKNTWIDWKVQNAAWLTTNAVQADVKTTPTGLQYKVLRQGIPGTKPDDIKNVRINYKGTLITGNVFTEEEDITFAMNEVIPGLAEGLKKMNQSGHYIFYIPQELGYGGEAQGTQGYESFIPPYSTLIFDVELIEVY